MTHQNLKDWYTVGLESRIKFTEFGKKEMSPLFSMAGIDINTIKTTKDLKQAYEASSPYIEGHHLSISQNGKPSMERNALIAVAKGHYDEVDRIIGLLQRRKIFKLV